MKIFGIGLPKTGSSSLKHALWELGFKKGGVYLMDDPDAEVFVGDYNCLPMGKYKSLDEKYPDARFILTARQTPETWYTSVERWAEKYKDHEGLRKQRKSMYGYEMPVREPFIRMYEDHLDNVWDYFANKYPEDWETKLLQVSWDSGDGWLTLCQFLGAPVPEKDFPHKNINK